MTFELYDGVFIGRRIKTVYNVNSETTIEYLTDIKYTVKKITENQYLVIQYDLANGNTVNLLFFKNNTGYLSTSDNGIDNIFEKCSGELIHAWSIPIDSNGNLTNAYTILNRV